MRTSKVHARQALLNRYAVALTRYQDLNAVFTATPAQPDEPPAPWRPTTKISAVATYSLMHLAATTQQLESAADRLADRLGTRIINQAPAATQPEHMLFTLTGQTSH